VAVLTQQRAQYQDFGGGTIGAGRVPRPQRQALEHLAVIVRYPWRGVAGHGCQPGQSDEQQLKHVRPPAKTQQYHVFRRDLQILPGIRAVRSMQREAIEAARPVNRGATAALLRVGAWRSRCADPL
jgi:hypothetical protein